MHSNPSNEPLKHMIKTKTKKRKTLTTKAMAGSDSNNRRHGVDGTRRGSENKEGGTPVACRERERRRRFLNF